MDGFGSVTWWGFSPALDLEQQWTANTLTGAREREDGGSQDTFPLNILLVGCGDLRHVLTTLANTRRPIHFFLAESCLELYARHMLFLKLLSEPKEQFGLHKKVEFFLELYGNSLLRAQTAEYLTQAAADLIKLVTDQDYQKLVLPILNLSVLKFKEHDFLEGIFKFWKHSHPFPIKELWDSRLRSYLAGRYDSRQGVYDWDYHMKLQDMAPLISNREYKEWRESGVAFKLRDDAPYQDPNRTMASGLLLREGGGDTVARRGYWGDIVSSPYLTFGISTCHKDLLAKAGGKHTKSSVQVSEHTLVQLVCQLTSTHPEGMKGRDSCSITFLPLQSVKDIAKKPRFQKFFNIAYFSNSMVHLLAGGVEATLAPHSVVLCEAVNFMLDLKKEKKEEYASKVKKMASSLNLKACDTQEGQHHLAFVL